MLLLLTLTLTLTLTLSAWPTSRRRPHSAVTWWATRPEPGEIRVSGGPMKAVVFFPPLRPLVQQHSKLGPWWAEAGTSAGVAPGKHPIVIISHGTEGAASVITISPPRSHARASSP